MPVNLIYPRAASMYLTVGNSEWSNHFNYILPNIADTVFCVVGQGRYGKLNLPYRALR